MREKVFRSRISKFEKYKYVEFFSLYAKITGIKGDLSG